ncbi:MAG: hypothetical protein RSD23_08810, partial [Ruthenibacterium sp.]
MIQAFPRVFLCNHSQSVALYNHTNIFSADKHYTLLCTACEKYTNEASAVQTEVIGGFPISHTTNKPSPLAVEYVDAHHLACTVNFSCEQEYILHLYEENSGTPTKLQSINLYAVEDDL